MKAFTTKFSGSLLAALILVLTFSGCNNAANQDKKANEATADTVKKEVTLSPESQSLLYQFPTPFEVTTLLENAKAGFIFDITNSPDNVGKYATEKAKALNLGVYSADLSYSATYNRTDETNKFLGATNKLADELGIAGVYDNTLFEKVKKYSNKKDSLVATINKVFGMTNDFLSKNNRNQIAVLIATGAFTEGLYLAASLNEVAKDNTRITEIIAKQKNNYDKLLTILQAYNTDSNMKPVADAVAKLQVVWTNYDIVPGKKLAQQKAAGISELTESVRLTFTK